MPEVSRFLGIVVTMYYDEHEPPHFHARYGDSRASIDARTRAVSGFLPRRALRLVLEWTELHTEELLLNWERAATHQSLKPIAPLE